MPNQLKCFAFQIPVLAVVILGLKISETVKIGYARISTIDRNLELRTNAPPTSKKGFLATRRFR